MRKILALASLLFVFVIPKAANAQLLSAATASGAPTVSAQVPASGGPLNLSSVNGWHDVTSTTLQAASGGCYSPFPGGSGNCSQVIRAWSGGAYNTDTDELLMFGGGHTDYFGNELYSMNLVTLAMTRITTPTPAASQGSHTPTCADANLDGTPAARHTYGGMVYVSSLKRLYMFGGAQACSSGAGTNGSWYFDTIGKTWHSLASPAFDGSQGVTQVDWDKNHGLIDLEDGNHFYTYNPTTDTWSARLATNGQFDIYSTGAFDPDANLFWMVGNNGGAKISRYDMSNPASPVLTNPTLDATCSPLYNAQAPGLAWSPVLHAFVGWPNFGNTVYLFNGESSAVTTTYGSIASLACLAVTFSGGPPDSAHNNNTASTTQGTYGRFRYVPHGDAFLICNDWNIDCYYLRLTNSVQSFQLTAPSTGTFPFTVGLGFKKGDVPSGSGLVLANATSQVVAKSTWNDGSVKTAIVSGRVALTSNVLKTLNVSIGTPSGVAKTCTDIQTAAPSASFQAGAIGTVNLSSLLASPFRTWVSGPEMVECHYRSNVGADATLVVWFHVRLYADGRVWVRTIAQNGYVNVTTADKSYVPTVVIGGSTVYNNGGAALTHYANTRWSAEGWIGGDPQITAKHDTAYLEATKLVPNYFNQTPSAAALNGLVQTYAPMNNAGWTLDMGATGFQNQIGILPLWDALFLTSGADSRAYNAVITAAKSLNGYPIVWNDSATNLPTSPVNRPTYTFAGANGGGATSINAGTLNFDIAHHGSGGYLAYLLTGDYYYLETLEDLSSMCFLMNNSAHGSGVNRTFDSIVQDRGVAWCNRTLSQLASVAPSTDTVAADYRTLLANTMTTLNNRAQAGGVTTIGYLLTYDVTTGPYLPYNGSSTVSVLAVWQQHFMIQSLGFGSDIEPLAAMTTYNALRDWSYKGIVGILGPNGPANYCFTNASVYNLQVADTQTGNLTLWYPDWGTTWTKNNSGVANNSCANTLLGGSGSDPLNAPTGYWGNLLPAIAYAYDHGAPGASASWSRLTGATNWTNLLNTTTPNTFGDIPIWGIVHR